MIDSWYILTAEQKEKFWNRYPFISIEFSSRLPNPNTYKGFDWLVPVADHSLKLVTEKYVRNVKEIKYIRFLKTRVTFALADEPLSQIFIWVQKNA